MSKMSKAVAGMQEANSLRLSETVTNFMGGDSYVVNPLDTLKMISASSIFGEPQYYVDGKFAKKTCKVSSFLEPFTFIPKQYIGKNTEDIMTAAIDAALDYDFGGTLEWAVELRNDYFMRLNPQVIMVRAAIHPKRAEWTAKNPGLFNAYNKKVMQRADDGLSQMSYYLFSNKGKKNAIPSVIKRSWADKLSSLTRYQVAKYKNHEIGMINGVRLCHANSPVINELMTTGTVAVKEDNMTWENLRSAGESWKSIFQKTDMGHMALLRNIRGVFTEVDDLKFCREYMTAIKDGVVKGKQFPFRYYAAIRAVASSNCNHKSFIINALEECVDIALENFPKLKGKTMCLSDNSGSAWGTFNSEYGSVTVAEIDNLSSVITAACSEDGYVGKFGDELKVYPVSFRQGILSQTRAITQCGSSDVGRGTEGGIWKFFQQAIENHEHWDNIFIYSDQQAGTGALYGKYSDTMEYENAGFECNGGMINVFKLVQEYRKKVNPKVNVFSIQTNGYADNVLPEYAYRTNLMYGWTGKEALFAQKIIEQWDAIEKKNSENIPQNS